MFKSPKTTAGAVIYRKRGTAIEVLLTKRNVEPFKNFWCIPGGHIEYYEEAITGAIREVKEETNLNFKPEFLCYLDEIFPERETHNVVLIFYGTATGELKKSDDEVKEALWFKIEDALKLDLAFSHHEALEIFSKKIENEVIII